MFPRFRDMRVGRRIGLGFGISSLLMVGMVLVVIVQIKEMEGVSQRVIKLRIPMVETSLRMMNGVNHSLASLRGWMLLGEEDFKKERQRAWREEIERSLKEMKEASPRWTNPDNVKQLAIVDKELQDFHKYQGEIEALANTLANTPANEILFKQAEPQAKLAINKIARIGGLELSNAATPERKHLMGILADQEASLGLALSNIESYLLSGNAKFRDRFETVWANNIKRFGELEAKSGLLNPEQKTLYQEFKNARQEFETLAPKMIKIREGEQWNLAKYLLANKAAPIADTIKHQLEAMLTSQDQLLIIDEQTTQNQIHSLLVLLVAFLFAGGLVSGVLGSAITKSISWPIQQLSRTMHEMALGKLHQRKLMVNSGDELGKLCDNFNKLIERLRKYD